MVGEEITGTGEDATSSRTLNEFHPHNALELGDVF
jgi:hypothetical protein